MGLIGNLLRHLTGSATGKRDKRSRTDIALDTALTVHESGKLDEAERQYLDVLRADPNNHRALHLRGVLLHQRGQHVGAAESIRRAIAVESGIALYHFNLGNVLAALGDATSAQLAFERACAIDVSYVPAWINLAKTRSDRKQLGPAVEAYRQAYALSPDTDGLRQAYCATLLSLGDNTAGNRAAYQEALPLLEPHWRSMDPPDAAHLMLAYCYNQLDRWTDSAQEYCAILAAPCSTEVEQKAHSNLGNTYNALGMMTEAVRHYREALRRLGDHTDTASSIAACVTYLKEASPNEVFRTHCDMAQLIAATTPATTTHRHHHHDADRRLRIGYMSPDFRRHPVTTLLLPILERHDRRSFDIVGYHNLAASDHVTEKVRGLCTQWREIADMPTEEVASLVEEDRIDILVDLAGHTASNRLPVFASKPAPVQVEWLGYYATSGLPTIDYFISDPHCSPPGQDRWFSEQLVRLPDTRFCYSPHEFMPEVNELPAIGQGRITFGCFNNLGKINEGVLRAWSRVAAKLPECRFILQTSALNDEQNRERFLLLAERCGLPRERLELRSFLPLSEAAKSYLEIDIALDPFPFSGGLTSLDSLWMGVPVVTLEMPLIAGRQSLAMLHNLDMADFVARNEDDYVDIAVRLASDLPALSDIRIELREKFRQSPLMDYQRFTEALEAAFQDMWHRRLSK